MDWLSNFTKEQLAALEQPVTSAQMKAYRRQTGLSRWTLGFDVGLTNSVVLAIGWIVFCISITIVMPLAPHWLTLVMMLGGLAAAAGVIFFRASQRAIRRHVRMSDYAARSGMQYDPIGKTNAVGTGLLFDIGHSRRYRGVLWYEQDGQRQLEIGRYRYAAGHGRQQQTYHWWYIGLRLARNVPHMVLDAKDDDMSLMSRTLLGDFPVVIPGNQRMSLEGDFDNHFTLYAPKKYDVDARYILTPDVMAALVDMSPRRDVELVDDVVFFYMPQPDKTTEAQMMDDALTLLSTVGRQLYDQTEYYADDRVQRARHTNAVAQQGRRLKWRDVSGL